MAGLPPRYGEKTPMETRHNDYPSPGDAPLSDATITPYPFADRDLARRLERTEANAAARFVEARARVFPQSGAGWMEVAGAFALYDGIDSPVTQTFGLGLFDPVTPGVLDEIEHYFAARGAPVIHEVCPLAGVALAALLHERGYLPVEFTSVMYRPIHADTGHAQTHGGSEVTVRVTGPAEADVWADTSAGGWGAVPGASEFLRDIGAINAAREDAVCFLAEMGGKPIAAAALCVSSGEGVAQMAGACTLPGARRRGAQLALLAARMRHGAARGCD
ncbi:MAG: GNAT family N-acetyltransferase, partial [Akkermansiaceae bacterium]|nr:GNAT family N-acetyltransferase [Armatimonadota bacterium]